MWCSLSCKPGSVYTEDFQRLSPRSPGAGVIVGSTNHVTPLSIALSPAISHQLAAPGANCRWLIRVWGKMHGRINLARPGAYGSMYGSISVELEAIQHLPEGWGANLLPPSVIGVFESVQHCESCHTPHKIGRGLLSGRGLRCYVYSGGQSIATVGCHNHG